MVIEYKLANFIVMLATCNTARIPHFLPRPAQTTALWTLPRRTDPRVTAFPASSRTAPPLLVSDHLAKKGFRLYFIAGSGFKASVDCGDVTVLATTPSLEYPTQSRHPVARFVGGLSLKPFDPAFVYPSWWPTVTANTALPSDSPEKKRVVFITQGTVHRDYTELIISTIPPSPTEQMSSWSPCSALAEPNCPPPSPSRQTPS
ncbi:hypothetical protein VTI74DRAFT_9304 [Chaetomium olivicolor]